MLLPPSTQMVLRAGYYEFNFGQPDPDLLPVEAMRRAPAAALHAFGATMLAYGAPEGAWPLLGWIRDRIEAREGIALSLDECIGTGGNSDAIDQVCTLFTQPGDIAFVESPTYHLGLKILSDHRLDLRPVPTDADGLQVDVLEEQLSQAAREGRRARLLYTIPTFHNPTGVNLSPARRQKVVDLAAEHELLVLEDDVYRELGYDATAPPSLFSIAPRGTVIRMGSFAKSLAPGLRLGWVNCSTEQARRFADGGLRDSGGAPNFATAMMVAALCAAGDFDTHGVRLRAAYRERRDTLAGALHESLPDGCAFDVPGGGYFIWVTLPAHVDTAALLARADEYKVAYLPGGRVSLDGANHHALRLSFALMKPAQLADGARRLGALLADSLN
jgi:DNA-binding transcriptional MocR family regulator